MFPGSRRVAAFMQLELFLVKSIAPLTMNESLWLAIGKYGVDLSILKHIPVADDDSKAFQGAISANSWKHFNLLTFVLN